MERRPAGPRRARDGDSKAALRYGGGGRGPRTPRGKRDVAGSPPRGEWQSHGRGRRGGAFPGSPGAGREGGAYQRVVEMFDGVTKAVAAPAADLARQVREAAE